MSDEEQQGNLPNSENDAKTFDVSGIQTGLWCTSVFMFISNELPALNADPSDDDLLKVKTFVSDTLKPYTGQESSELGQIFFRNTLSIAAKLLLSVLEAALSNEMVRLKIQRDMDTLVHEWKDRRAAGGGIAVVDGKPVHGPRLPGEEEDIPILAAMSFMGLGGIDTMQRVMRKEQ